MNLDLKIFYFFNNLVGHSHFFDMLVVFLADYFQYILILIFLLILFFSKRTKKEKIIIFLVVVASVAVARLGVTELIRFFWHRPRPFLVYPVSQLLFNGQYSFPSGHAAFFFSMAAALWFYYKKWGLGFFAAAIFITLSRVIGGIHYPSDILGGLVVGILSAIAGFYLIPKLVNKFLAKS